jgi:hypothetical protein
VYYSVQLYFYLAAAQGWCTTRLHLDQGTWRMNILLSFGFYVANTMMAG